MPSFQMLLAPSEKKGSGRSHLRDTDSKVQILRLGSCGRGLFENRGCPANFCDTEVDVQRIRTGFQIAVCVVDIDVCLAQTRRYA